LVKRNRKISEMYMPQSKIFSLVFRLTFEPKAGKKRVRQQRLEALALARNALRVLEIAKEDVKAKEPAEMSARSSKRRGRKRKDGTIGRSRLTTRIVPTEGMCKSCKTFTGSWFSHKRSRAHSFFS
jgi:hypothetical protein